ncbi:MULTISPECIES: urease accessory protein UreE [Methylobacterium]|uniref:Urease accessory protein UreE n=1 Tax=Methylobacterium jeotgali TaxID=381630 RepID=A0ABQ4SWH5_9HYPH|nr:MULTISPECIES: urease accessory protein UreE [Methylobacterium]PIU05349.1 MAG: urease accessory protein UreE [Methylobacterium sp. CG09_land_8_20_14_0_10_71_15]PIU12189.1 MAG: urease accessory protein UreE [Methylobacterium sp. CG08_land_8_20_14_0_20_71_15]GBU18187.1 urease accessory protein UreE 1 [Methylobacterium sp.]GJE06233.1 Urease accessory protein UreE [Methylobacterium jeotgali]
MRVIQRVLGSRLDAAFAERLHHLEHHGAVDVLRVPSADTARRRLRAVTEGGEEIALALPRDQTLFDGAVLVLEDHRAIVARVGAVRWLRLRAKNLPDALELGYHAGNLHWRVRFADGALLVALEAPAEDYLVRLGDLAGDGRLAHDVVDDAPGEA